MKTHLVALRFYVTERLIAWALRVVPRGTVESRELAIFIQHSWIARLAQDEQRAQLQRDWQAKLRERGK